MPPPLSQAKAASATRENAKYRRIRDGVLEAIQGGRWPVGDRLPAEVELMRQHGVSRGTVRRAMLDLELAGYIRRRPGSGTFVASDRPHPRRPMRWAFIPRFRHQADAGMDGLEAYAREVGAHLDVEYMGDSAERFETTVARLLGEGVDGFIVEPLVYETRSRALLTPIVRAGVPLVLTRVPVAGIDAPLVVFDHEAVGRQATQHLLDMGHRRIGYVSSPRYWSVDREIEGYRAALIAFGIEPRDEWVSFEERVSEERGYAATRMLLALPDPPTAVLTLNDVTAANAYRAIRALGLRVPQDVSVIAASGIGPHLAGALDPPLTVWCPAARVRRIGEMAGEVLEALIERRWPADAKLVTVDPTPLPRGSVDRAPHARRQE